MDQSPAAPGDAPIKDIDLRPEQQLPPLNQYHQQVGNGVWHMLEKRGLAHLDKMQVFRHLSALLVMALENERDAAVAGQKAALDTEGNRHSRRVANSKERENGNG